MIRYQRQLFEAVAAGEFIGEELVDEASRELTADAVECGHDPTSPGVARWRRDLRATAMEHNARLSGCRVRDAFNER